MNTERLKGFIAAADCGSISIAANECHISQSALSTQIQTLENETNCTLFSRTSKGVILTNEGRVYYNYAKRALQLEDDMTKALADEKSGNSGVLRVAVSMSSVKQFAGNALRLFMHDFPNTRCEITETNADGVLSSVKDNLADIGLIISNTLPTDGIFVHQIKKEPLALIYESSFDINSVCRVADLKDIRIYTTRKLYEQLAPYCEANGFKLKIAGLCEHYETAVTLAVNCCDGAALVPHFLADIYSNSKIETAESFNNARYVKVYNAAGERVYPDVGDAPGVCDDCSVLLKKGFDGYLLYPLDYKVQLPVRQSKLLNLPAVPSLQSVTDVNFDFRISGGQQGMKYYIGSVYLADDYNDITNGNAVLLEDFNVIGNLAQNWTMLDLYMYGQMMPTMLVEKRNGENCLCVRVPSDHQWADVLLCCSQWIKRAFNTAHGKRYLAIKIANPEIPDLGFSLGFRQYRTMKTCLFDDPGYSYFNAVISSNSKPLSGQAKRFLELYCNYKGDDEK